LLPSANHVRECPELSGGHPGADWRTGLDRYADEEGSVETDGLRNAIGDWRDGEIDTDLLRDVIDARRSG